jgi:glycosyltransferase involved in cell wall biosynthesis
MTNKGYGGHDKNPLVTIIIPCFNADSYLMECVESCLAQTYSRLEIIIIDDGNGPSTKSLLKEIENYDEKRRIRVISHQGHINKGVLASRLLGLKHAKGSLISLLDADDQYHPCRIERQLECFSRFPEVVLSHSGIEIIGDRSGALSHEFHFSSSPSIPYRLQALPDFLYRLHICNSAAMFRADALRGASIPSKMLYQLEDWVFWILLSRKGLFVQLPEPLTRYRIHQDSFSFQNNTNRLQKQFSRIEFLLIVFLYTFPSFYSLRSLVLLVRALAGAAALHLEAKSVIEIGAG